MLLHISPIVVVILKPLTYQMFQDNIMFKFLLKMFNVSKKTPAIKHVISRRTNKIIMKVLDKFRWSIEQYPLEYGLRPRNKAAYVGKSFIVDNNVACIWKV